MADAIYATMLSTDQDLETPDGVRRTDLASRIGARAVASGTFVALAVAGLLLSLIGVAARTLDVHVAIHFGFGTFLWALVSWLIAISAGSFVAARVGRANRPRDGALYGIVTWATACVAAGVIACTWYMAAVGVGIVSPEFGDALMTRGAFAAFFAADVLAIGAALVAGTLATRAERREAGAARGEPRPAPIGGPAAAAG